MQETPWYAGPAARTWRTIPRSFPCRGGVTAERRSVPLSSEGAAGQQIRCLGTLLQQVRERAGDLADEVLRLAIAELRVGRDRANVELPFARLVLGAALGYEPLGDREAA